jgi:iron complex outermembrane recepter protein
MKLVRYSFYLVQLSLIFGLTVIKSVAAEEINNHSDLTRTIQLKKISKQQRVSTSARDLLETRARIQELKVNEVHPDRNKSQDIAQDLDRAEITRVTGVELKQTDKGLEVILKTVAGSQTLAPLISPEGNNLVVNIPNAILSFAIRNGVTETNPAPEISEVTVTKIDDNNIRLTITGEKQAPSAEIIPGSNLVLSVTPKEATTESPFEDKQASEEELEIVVTGEREEDDNYSVPDATTATKTDTPLRDVPQSIQVVPRQVIEDQKVTRISDAVRNVSGVSVERGYADNTDVYRIRGFVNYDSLRNGFFAQDPSISPNNIERVEVLKGPGSVLYGQFEPGGIVNYVTKKPLDKPYYSAEFTAGNYDFYNPAIDFSGPLNKDKTLLYRLNASYLDSGNFVDFVEQQQFAIATALTYKISNATTLDFEYEYIDENRAFYDGLLPERVSFDLPISRNLGDPSADDYTSSTNNINLTLNHRFNDNLQLRSRFGTQLGTFGSATVRLGSLLEDGRTISRGYQIDDNVEIENYSLQTDLIGKFNTGSIKHQLLFGFDLSRYVYADDYYFDPDSSTVPPLDLFNPVYGGFPIPDRSQLTFDPFRNERDNIGIYLREREDPRLPRSGSDGMKANS